MSACKLCRHIMPTGRTCKAVAMRGSAWCYYHGPQKSPRAASHGSDFKLEFERIVDPSSITGIGEQVLQALASNRISKAKAAVMFQGLQTIMAGWKISLADEFYPADALGSIPQHRGEWPESADAI